MNKKQKIHDVDWKQRLSPEKYRILREKGTEAPFSGKYVDHKENGFFVCAACGNPLFSSDAKFDSGTGWPSFDKTVSPDAVEFRTDTGHGLIRIDPAALDLYPNLIIEVLCGQCGGHLGHVFDDGPLSTGKRFCMNSVALHFKKR